jgi:hypothetical protein
MLKYLDMRNIYIKCSSENCLGDKGINDKLTLKLDLGETGSDSVD